MGEDFCLFDVTSYCSDCGKEGAPARLVVAPGGYGNYYWAHDECADRARDKETEKAAYRERHLNSIREGNEEWRANHKRVYMWCKAKEKCPACGEVRPLYNRAPASSRVWLCRDCYDIWRTV